MDDFGVKDNSGKKNIITCEFILANHRGYEYEHEHMKSMCAYEMGLKNPEEWDSHDWEVFNNWQNVFHGHDVVSGPDAERLSREKEWRAEQSRKWLNEHKDLYDYKKKIYYEQIKGRNVVEENKPTYEQLEEYYHRTCGLWAIDRSPQEVDLKWITGNAFQLGSISDETTPEEIKELEIPEGYEFEKAENGKVILKRKKPKLSEFPRTFTECLDVDVMDLTKSPFLFYARKEKERAISSLLKLIVCRDAWWKLLGWNPDWDSTDDCKFGIGTYKNEIKKDMCVFQYNRILVFPTSDIRDKFFEVFKDYIEEVKEFL